MVLVEKKTRDRAVKNLAAFLSSEAPENALSKSEMDKLWKGIFYCMFFCPRVIRGPRSEQVRLLDVR
jgi:ribosomal RNA-processing protein 1